MGKWLQQRGGEQAQEIDSDILKGLHEPNDFIWVRHHQYRSEKVFVDLGAISQIVLVRRMDS